MVVLAFAAWFAIDLVRSVTRADMRGFRLVRLPAYGLGLVLGYAFVMALTSQRYVCVCDAQQVVLIAVCSTWHWWAYLIMLSFFHFSEYFTTALFKGSTLSFDCVSPLMSDCLSIIIPAAYILNHSTAYTAAAVASWVEFWIEWYFFPSLKAPTLLSFLGIIVPYTL